MGIVKSIAAAVTLGMASALVAGCATGLPTKVTRYSAMPVPAGQTFQILPAPGQSGGLEFATYAAMIARQLEAKGYRATVSPELADMIVKVDFGVDEGKVEYVADRPYGPRSFGWSPYAWGYRDPFFDSHWRVHPGYPYWSPWSPDPFYYGWDDPFWYASPYAGYGAFGPRIREYIRYYSHLDMEIVRRADNAPLFDGHVKARSQTDELARLVPNLIAAIFTDFPGRNGETVRITVPARKQGQAL